MTIIIVSPEHEHHTALRTKQTGRELRIHKFGHEPTMLVDYTHMQHLSLISYFISVFGHKLISHLEQSAECLVVEETRTVLSVHEEIFIEVFILFESQ